jgi:hypothetical protein
MAIIYQPFICHLLSSASRYTTTFKITIYEPGTKSNGWNERGYESQERSFAA